MRTLASRLKSRTFSTETNDGFLVERVRDASVEGRYFEKVRFEEVIRDPFGNEQTFERLLYREIEFVFSSKYPQVELRRFPRSLQSFITRTAELTEFATAFVPLNIDTFKWADNIRDVFPRRFRIDLAQLSEVVLEERVIAKMVLSSEHDIRAAITRFTNRRQHRVDRIQIKIEYADELLSMQLAADGTLRTIDPLPQEILDTVRQALPATRAEE
jgi:hypothetical protein